MTILAIANRWFPGLGVLNVHKVPAHGYRSMAWLPCAVVHGCAPQVKHIAVVRDCAVEFKHIAVVIARQSQRTSQLTEASPQPGERDPDRGPLTALLAAVLQE